MSSVETGQMSAAETGPMSAAETEQMSAVKTRQMLKSQIRGRAQNRQNDPKWVENGRQASRIHPNESHACSGAFGTGPAAEIPAKNSRSTVVGEPFGKPSHVKLDLRQAAPLSCFVKVGSCPCSAGSVVPDRGISLCPCHVGATRQLILGAVDII